MLLLKIKDVNRRLYEAILYKLFSIHGYDGLIQSLEVNRDLTQEEKGDILISLPLCEKTFNIIRECSETIQDYYWTNVGLSRIDELNDNCSNLVINKLLEYSRPFSAAEAIAYSEYSDTVMILKVLENCFHINNKPE